MANFEEIDSFNAYADFWFYTIGANIIPADTINKTTHFEWAEYENKPIEEENHKLTKKNGGYGKGIAVMAGLLYRGEYKGKYLSIIDKDNKKGIEEFLSRFGKVNTS